MSSDKVNRESWKVFEAEMLKCECTSCKNIVRAIFSAWSTPAVRDTLMDAFVQHAEVCFYHRYQAHQHG